MDEDMSELQALIPADETQCEAAIFTASYLPVPGHMFSYQSLKL